MGSKRKSAGKIYQTIKNFNPHADILVDLFCGGFAISEYFLKNGYKIIANDKNKYVIELIKKVIKDGLPEQVFDFIPREKFYDIKKNPKNYDDWFVGFSICIYSFGNQQQYYLFKKNVEKYKKAGHEFVMNKNAELLETIGVKIPKKIKEKFNKIEKWQKRRMAFIKIHRIIFPKIRELQELQQLESLQRLEQLQQLEQKVSFSSEDYRKIKIPVGAIVYCDPPYQGTKEYMEKGFQHDVFWDWVRKKSKTNKLYVSEYEAPEDFKKVLEFEQKSTLCQGTAKNTKNECLFTLI